MVLVRAEAHHSMTPRTPLGDPHLPAAQFGFLVELRAGP
jgi:hypothetical protein